VAGDGSDPAAVLLQQLAVAEALHSGRTTAAQRQLRAWRSKAAALGLEVASAGWVRVRRVRRGVI